MELSDSFDDGKAFLMLVQDCFLTHHVAEPTKCDTKINARQCESDRYRNRWVKVIIVKYNST